MKKVLSQKTLKLICFLGGLGFLLACYLIIKFSNGNDDFVVGLPAIMTFLFCVICFAAAFLSDKAFEKAVTKIKTLIEKLE